MSDTRELQPNTVAMSTAFQSALEKMDIIGLPSDPGSRLRRKLRKRERQNKLKARRA